MASIKEMVKGVKPVIAYPKTIEFGPVTLDGYMLEDGEFRQSITSTGRAIGGSDKFSWLVKKTIERLLTPSQEIAATATGLALSDPDSPSAITASGSKNLNTATDLTLIDPESPGPIIQPVICPGVINHTQKAYTINLPMVVEVWKQIALSHSKYSRTAMELLGLSAVHSLERVYQEAFGVQDSRKTSDRLLDWAIRMDAGKHFPLFGGAFHKHFARVTGVAIGHRYAPVCMAELVYHRLPETIYETLKDINPADEQGWRQFSHSQLMTDEMRQQMREIVAAVTSQLANTESKANNPDAYRKCLHRLDKTLPRYKKRGGNIDNFLLKEEQN